MRVCIPSIGRATLDRNLTKFEQAALLNLCPTNVDEARSLIRRCVSLYSPQVRGARYCSNDASMIIVGLEIYLSSFLQIYNSVEILICGSLLLTPSV